MPIDCRLLEGLCHDAQAFGIKALMWKCLQFKRLDPENHCVVAYLGYESDCTEQGIAQHLIQKIGRPSTRRLNTEVLNHRGVIRMLLTSPSTSTMIVEPYVCRSQVLLGKSATFLYEGNRRGRLIDLSDDAWLKVLAMACDEVIEDMQQDQGSTNLPALKAEAHWALKAGVIFDASCCIIHVLNRVKNSCEDVVTSVGKQHSLGLWDPHMST